MKLKADKLKPPKSQKAYLKRYGHCPVCDSANISGDSIEVDGSTAWQGVGCSDCGATWNDVYRLSSYEELRMEVKVEPMNPADLGDIDFTKKN